MLTAPFDPDAIWQGRIQRANYPKPAEGVPMNLLPLSYHGGQSIIYGKEYTNMLKSYCDPDGLVKGYNEYSRRYWAGVERRKREFRAQRIVEAASRNGYQLWR